MTGVSIFPPILAQGNAVVWVVMAVLLLAMLLFMVAFVRLFGLWVRARTSGAPVSLVELLAMKLRKTNANEIVRLKIMAVQNGIDIPTEQLERAYLAGADVERAVLAMVRANETGKAVTWEEVIQADREERLKASG